MKQIGEKRVVIDGKEYPVKVFEAKPHDSSQFVKTRGKVGCSSWSFFDGKKQIRSGNLTAK